MPPIFFRYGDPDRRMCTAKKPYPTREAAERGHNKQNYYHCPYCKKWHVSAKNKAWKSPG